MRILHVAAESTPFIKTGGLGDVIGALPAAQQRLGHEVRVLLPGYPAVLEGLAVLGELRAVGPDFIVSPGSGRVRLLRTVGDATLVHYVIDAPWLYERPGNPYVAANGQGWPDNQRRFALLGWLGAQLAGGRFDPAWSPQIVHCHDWHAGLVPAWLNEGGAACTPSLFSIHNVAFQGRFAGNGFAELGLSARWFSPLGMEFHGDLSFMKAALQSATAIATVSPTYAMELQQPEFGHGLDGVIRQRAASLFGILNGIDTDLWNPATDLAIAARYDANDPDGRRANRDALLRRFGLQAAVDGNGALPFVMGVVSRLTDQKGIDLIVDALPALLDGPSRMVVLGNGDAVLQNRLEAAASAFPGKLAIDLGFDDSLARQIFAGADALLVPSRFEPCGLTQLYAMRYGAVPIVRQTGGLADTVCDVDLPTDGRVANGFSFRAATPTALIQCVGRARALFADLPAWQRLVRAAMIQDHSWQGAATEYVRRYQQLVDA